MKTSTITERLYAKADKDLKARLNDSVSWVWNETGHSCHNPSLDDFPEVSKNFTNDGSAPPSKMPWIGRVLELFKHVAFAYLRDKWRDKYVADFMSKVEAMASEMENLGIAIQAQEES